MNLPNAPIARCVQSANGSQPREVRKDEVEIAARLANVTVEFRTAIPTRCPRLTVRVLFGSTRGVSSVAAAFLLGLRPPGVLGPKDVFDFVIEQDDRELAAVFPEVLHQLRVELPLELVTLTQKNKVIELR